jgi:hypothetical protein
VARAWRVHSARCSGVKSALPGAFKPAIIFAVASHSLDFSVRLSTGFSGGPAAFPDGFEERTPHAQQAQSTSETTTQDFIAGRGQRRRSLTNSSAYQMAHGCGPELPPALSKFSNSGIIEGRNERLNLHPPGGRAAASLCSNGPLACSVITVQAMPGGMLEKLRSALQPIEHLGRGGIGSCNNPSEAVCIPHTNRTRN